jgi:hypothetical protein
MTGELGRAGSEYLDSAGVRFLEAPTGRTLATGPAFRIAEPQASSVPRVPPSTGLLLRCPFDPNLTNALAKVQS